MAKLIFVIVCVCCSCFALVSQGKRPPVASARSFIDSLGVVVHMEYTNSQYANVNDVQNDFEYLGVRFARDEIPTGLWLPPGQGIRAIRALGQLGIRFVICVGADLSNDLYQLEALEAFRPGMVAAVEGFNEVNNHKGITYKGQVGNDAAILFQRDLCNAVRSSRLLSDVPVYNFTGGQPIDRMSLDDLADFANGHPYPRSGAEPRQALLDEFLRGYINLGGFPRVITETGYYTLPESENWGDVDEITQAKLLLTTLFTAAEVGVSKTFIYQLLDAYDDPAATNIEAHFGLFDLRNRAKPSAQAIHRVTTFLSDPRTSLAEPDFDVQGLPQAGHYLVLSKSDGSYVVSVWNEVRVWDSHRHLRIVTEPVPATLCVGPKSRIMSYDPLTGDARMVPLTSSCASVLVPDHPVMLRVIPRGIS